MFMQMQMLITFGRGDFFFEKPKQKQRPFEINLIEVQLQNKLDSFPTVMLIEQAVNNPPVKIFTFYRFAIIKIPN